MAAPATTIKVDQKPFVLKITDNNPLVEYNGKQYRDLTELVKDASQLSDAKNLCAFVKIANFIFRGNEFDVIDNCESFKKRYATITKVLPQYGSYNTSELKTPFITDGELVFFAEHSTMHVPYRVTCTFPYVGKSAKFKYSLLPQG